MYAYVKFLSGPLSGRKEIVSTKLIKHFDPQQSYKNVRYQVEHNKKLCDAHVVELDKNKNDLKKKIKSKRPSVTPAHLLQTNSDSSTAAEDDDKQKNCGRTEGKTSSASSTKEKTEKANLRKMLSVKLQNLDSESTRQSLPDQRKQLDKSQQNLVESVIPISTSSSKSSKDLDVSSVSKPNSSESSQQSSQLTNTNNLQIVPEKSEKPQENLINSEAAKEKEFVESDPVVNTDKQCTPQYQPSDDDSLSLDKNATASVDKGLITDIEKNGTELHEETVFENEASDSQKKSSDGHKRHNKNNSKSKPGIKPKGSSSNNTGENWDNVKWKSEYDRLHSDYDKLKLRFEQVVVVKNKLNEKLKETKEDLESSRKTIDRLSNALADKVEKQEDIWTNISNNLKTGEKMLYEHNFLPITARRLSPVDQKTRVHIGLDVWILEKEYNQVIINSKSPSQFAANILLPVFEEEELMSSTISGYGSGRQGGKKAKVNKLDEKKLAACEGFYKYWLANMYDPSKNKNSDKDEEKEAFNMEEELTKFQKYAGKKISDMKRPEGSTGTPPIDSDKENNSQKKPKDLKGKKKKDKMNRTSQKEDKDKPKNNGEDDEEREQDEIIDEMECAAGDDADKDLENSENRTTEQPQFLKDLLEAKKRADDVDGSGEESDSYYIGWSPVGPDVENDEI